jgi:hypothetical protein
MAKDLNIGCYSFINMALNDIKYLKTKLARVDIAETLLGLGKSINDYLSTSLPKDATLDCFFQTFCNGHKELQPTEFFVQTRLKKGRAGIGYSFKSADATDGELRVSVFDNGENVPQEQFEAVYSKLREYVCQRRLAILDEGVKPEY